MKTIVLASNNEHKLKEIRKLLTGYKILSLKDINFKEEIEENADTFIGNALIKAKTIHGYLNKKNIEAYVIADDSGLCVDCLDGDPGIYSARYAGEKATPADNRNKLLHELKDKKNRSAHYVCVIVEYFPDGNFIYSEGKTYGEITYEEIGDKSFGYDCIFFSHELCKTFGEATDDEKNRVSHRAKAMKKLLKIENQIINRR